MTSNGKGILIAGLLVAFGTATWKPVEAADLRRERSGAQVMGNPVAVKNWTGAYLGGNIGYAFGSSDIADTIGTPGFVGLIPGGIVPGQLRLRREGVIGGVQAGYNIQTGSFVLGLETDIQILDAGKSASFTGNPVLGTPLTTSARSRLEYLGTLRGRVGYLATENVLLYVTGGLAYGGVDSRASVNGVLAPALSWNGSKSEVKAGYALGAGAEYRLTANWSIKGEYLYYDLGRQTVRTTPNAAAAAAVPGVVYDARIKTSGQIIRAGLNYAF
ncbi:MAG: porin family protein [Beijerinckiaceae bacterium]|nr:porin family protein [Brevundimonas sp.]MCZ8302019.1 porin family protein [Beijerinckiaceae bacterium]